MERTIHKAVQYVFAFMTLIFLSYCAQPGSGEGSSSGAADTLLSRKISFPKSLSLLESGRFRTLDSVRVEWKGRKKIISLVDGTCPSCIMHQLNAMDSAFTRILLEHDCVLIFILNVSKADSGYFMLNVQQAIKAKGIVLRDDSYAFETQNKLLTEDMNLRTFMTDRENRIIQYGNPLMNPGLLARYQENLKE